MDNDPCVLPYEHDHCSWQSVRLPMGIIILNMDYLEKGSSMDKPKALLVDVLEGTLSKPSKPE